jgi:hypothetical protein
MANRTRKTRAAGPRAARKKIAVHGKAAAGGLQRANALSDLLSDDSKKRIAVITCVSGAMDANQRGWNDDGRGLSKKMDDDFGYNKNSMPAFLDVVRACLKPKYSLDTDDDNFIEKCVSATVAELEHLIIRQAK